MRRALLTLLFLLCAAALMAPAAGAAPKLLELLQPKIGKVTVSTPPVKPASLLVPVSYPIGLSGARPSLVVVLREPNGRVARTRTVRTTLSAGPLRSPDTRKRFTFVHRIAAGADLSRLIDAGGSAEVKLAGGLDLDGDGRPELGSDAATTQALKPAHGRRVCATPAPLRVRPGQALRAGLPTCSGGGSVSWRISRPPAHGSARIEGGQLVYRPSQGFLGADSVRLSDSGGGAPVRITVGRGAEAPVVRAFGDSVTAGFGYYEEGELMEITSLLGCKPGLDDACSSNSKVRSNRAPLEYSSDYGLANNVSWAAQWANEYGVTDYKNFAVSGSEASNWYGKGRFAGTLAQLESEDPDYVLLTMGANPLLADMLFGAENMGCAIYADFFGRYDECLEKAFAEVELQGSLEALYENLVANTSGQIFVMQYHLSVPSVALAYSAAQIAEMGRLVNREIAAVAAKVGSSRLTVVAPPHFNVGIDISPVYPAKFTCSYFEYPVDGPSVQSDPTQDELEALHYLSFCPGPKSGPPWVISGDTGIHPSAVGYAQMAAQVPAPR